MQSAAKEMDFEMAAKIRNTISALNHINDTSLISDEFINGSADAKHHFVVESYDVAHTMGENMVGVMVVMEGGLFNKSRYRKFNIKRYKKSNDPGALREILERRLGHTDWPLPNLFIVDGGKAQYNAFQSVLAEAGISIPIIAVTKGVGHKARGYIGDREIISNHEDVILQSNAEAHRFAITWHRAKQRKRRFT
jgi:excinuclease ABC subunit C